MATVTKPGILDTTGQSMLTKMDAIKTAIEALAPVDGNYVEIPTTTASSVGDSDKVVGDGQYITMSTIKTYIGGANGDLTPDGNRTRNIGSKERQYNELFVKYLALGGYRCDSAGLHNGLYRGALLYDAVSSTAGVFASIDEAYNVVNSGDFSDIYIGDYFLLTISTTYTSSETVKMVVAGIDYYLHRGGTEVTTHHLVLVPENCFTATASMNSSSTTSGGYKSSAMQGTVLPKYATALSTALGGHLLSIPFYFSSTVNTSAQNDNGASLSGASSARSEVTTNISLMTEAQVFGMRLYSNLYDLGYVTQQLPLFALRPDLVPCGLGHNATSRNGWWLSGVASSSYFCLAINNGSPNYSSASSTCGVRPLVLFG